MGECTSIGHVRMIRLRVAWPRSMSGLIMLRVTSLSSYSVSKMCDIRIVILILETAIILNTMHHDQVGRPAFRYAAMDLSCNYVKVLRLVSGKFAS